MWVSEVKFQHTKGGPSFMELGAFAPGAVHVVVATWAQDPRDGVQNYHKSRVKDSCLGEVDGLH